MYDINYIYDLLIELGMFTEEELQLVTCINGFSIETLSDCLFVRYGYDVEQFIEELEENAEEEEEDKEEEEEEETLPFFLISV